MLSGIHAERLGLLLDYLDLMQIPMHKALAYERQAHTDRTSQVACQGHGLLHPLPSLVSSAKIPQDVGQDGQTEWPWLFSKKYGNGCGTIRRDVVRGQCLLAGDTCRAQFAPIIGHRP